MTDALEAVVAAVRERVSPDPDERERLADVVETLRSRATEALAEHGLADDADIVLVGSTARRTWIAGDRDVDVFVRLPVALDREELERVGLAVGHAVLPDGREEYAEHPYVTGELGGFDVDLVPCYAVEDATDIRSAVDRTPFHTAYLEERLDAELAGEVRVAKAFCKAIGVYGSDLRTRGFSGFLVELLVLEFGGFVPFLTAVADWESPVRLDPEDHGERSFDDPLVVVDPTDPERNVAAVLSETNLARLQHHARDVLTDPRESAFEATEPDPVDAATVRAVFDDRGTAPLALRFPAPDLVEDDLYPQLETSRRGLAGILDRNGFDVLRSAAFAETGDRIEGGDASEAGERTAVLLFECAVAERPAIERHEGPPVAVREHAERFHDDYTDDPDVTGPFVDGDRYAVERPREHRTARELLGSDAVFDVSLGVAVERTLADGYDLLVGDEVAALADRFGTDLARYLDPRP